MIIDQDTLLIALFVAVIIALAFFARSEIRLNRFLRGKNAKSLEELLLTQASEVEKLKRFRKELEAYLLTVESRLSKGARGIETVRFNPFKGTGDGGNQSFATAIINEAGDGVAFSSIYSRERVIMFAKPLKNGKSEYELTAEEKMAIRKAQEKLRL